jgi:hypothetical protein
MLCEFGAFHSSAVKDSGFWDVMLQSCIHFHQKETYEALKMKVTHYCETLGANYLVMQHHIPEN